MTKDAMTQQPGLCAGSLAGQDLSLLRAGSSVLLDPHWGLMIFDRFDDSERRAFLTGIGDGQVRLLIPAKMPYLGERAADGWIHVPEGGWPCNPVPGHMVEVRFDSGVERGNALSDRWTWPKGESRLADIIAFRPAPSAVEPAPEAVSSEGDYGDDLNHTKETCEDRRLVAAGYLVCGSAGDTRWHWKEPDGRWHDVRPDGRYYRSEHAAARDALARLSGRASHTLEQPDSRSGAGEKLGFNPFGTGLSEPRIGPAPSQPQQPDTMAEGLGVPSDYEILRDTVPADLLDAELSRLGLEDLIRRLGEGPIYNAVADHRIGAFHGIDDDATSALMDEAAKALTPHAEATRLLAEKDREIEVLTTGGIIEVAVRNPNVSSYVKEWEGRTLAAEADAAKLREALSDARAVIHQHYVDWDGEPEDAVPLQEARTRIDAALAQTKGRT